MTSSPPDHRGSGAGELPAPPRTVELRAGTFAYRRWQPAGPVATVLLLHGNGDSSATWSRLGPALCRAGIAAVAPDLRGNGGSVRPPAGSYALGAVAADVGELVEVLGLHRPIVLGHCWGAAVAVLGAAGAFGPGREIAGLVLEELPATMASTLAKPAVRDFLRLLRSPRGYVESWAALVCRSWDPVDRQSLLDALLGTDDAVYLSAVHDGTVAGDLIAPLSGLAVPCLALRGSPGSGSIVEDADWRRLKQLLPPGSAAHEFTDRGHELHRGDLPRFARLVSAFVHDLT